MNKVFQIWVFAGLLLGVCLAGKGAEPEPTLEFRSLNKQGEWEYSFETGLMTATNGAVIIYGKTELTANHITLEQKTSQAVADGNVTLVRDGQIWQGKQLEYNFKTGELKADDFRSRHGPFFIAGAGLEGTRTNGVYGTYLSYLTTDDVADPAYRIRAQTMVIVPGKMIEAQEATLYIGNVPVFYWPYYRRSLDRHPNNIVLTPGYRSLYGPYLMGAYHWYANTNLSGVVDLDYRQRRGVGGGPEVKYDLGQYGAGEFRYYATRDDLPGTNTLGVANDPFRERISFSHQLNLRTNFTAQVEVNYQSDPFVLRDFFDREYLQNVQPSSFLELNQLWSNYSLNVLAQPRVNDFYETVERLPDIQLNGMRQEIGNTPLYYESQSSVGYFRHEYADNVLPAFSAWRADTYHQVVLPQTYFGWLNFEPRVGGRLTHYSAANGGGITTTEEDRGVFNTGAEFSFKASRLWADTQSKFWDVDGLRHIIEPSLNYVFVPSPNVLPPQLPQFDAQQPSFYLVPIEYPDYNAIDSIDSQNVIRFGLQNRFQTKRNGQLDTLVNWQLYLDWRLKPRPGQGTFSDVFSSIDFKPRTWLTFTSETRYNIGPGQWQEAAHYLTLKPQQANWSWSLGHRYLQADPTLGAASGNNTIINTFYYRLNENWGVRVSHYFEAGNGRMEEQYYTLYRDLRSWTSALTMRMLQDAYGHKDFTIAVTFSLKAHPRFSQGSDSVSPSLLLGGS